MVAMAIMADSQYNNDDNDDLLISFVFLHPYFFFKHLCIYIFSFYGFQSIDHELLLSPKGGTYETNKQTNPLSLVL